MPDSVPLPDEVALLWGRREAPRRGPKATLTIDEIVRAAVGVADADGLAAVSMAKVAAELGRSTMALYRHVRSKDELLMLMGDAAVATPPDLSGADWRTGLTTWALSIVETLREHSWFTQLPLSGPPVGPNNLAWFESALRALTDTPLAELEKVGVVQNLITLVHGEVRLGRELQRSFDEDPAKFGRYGEVLAELIDPVRFPALSRVVSSGAFSEPEMINQDLAEDFRFGLSLFLDGVEAYMQRRAG
ncbi:TetR/AcrR family transcriptional regulator [Pseudonocardia humida]|uniref:TetR/AcrR family transcriptional regulator C-terminal domain-containing protein n=1 Tax=Pseudonocardia humida TaxID=2800819 RepID=A0ABT1A7H8_9PSEU|nr:TetR/AcrR family transcriptional regulator [Pseudonocardia humida]MCO1658916.1 TetR/AcrR family transcriptional regulator C-terminal domain-containing protein [Pseudonocardia humida]